MTTELRHSVSECFINVVPLLHKKLMRSLPADAKSLNLTRSSFEILRVLYERRKATISELCSLMHISRPNMTPLLDKLEELRLVLRQSAEGDRRVTEVVITEEGESYCSHIRELFLEQIRSKLATLGEEDLAELGDCLATLKKIAGKIEP
ncbi:MarR family winged helix-turn-helix transcriptional regulator [Cohnella suwonensis]|uniref:MarR family winged helix-turn-helix transcriptional regulator n=1 Tax=Cohnella suwonensis TaxID=696072 RepID=A0ABW0LWH3_9BACL